MPGAGGDTMDDWIDYYDSTHTIYVSNQHRDLHFSIIADDIISYISSPDAVVLDYACGEAMSAARVAQHCSRLILAEPAPGVRGRLIARFARDLNIKVRSLEDVRYLDDNSTDLVVMISVAQYMTPSELDSAFTAIHRVLKPGGRFILGDILKPNVGATADIIALLRMARHHGFLKDALIGLIRTYLSDYWHLRTSIGLQRYSESEMIAKLEGAGFSASRTQVNVGHNPARMTFVARHAF
jgi:ubiquinone/menaquinone biosynthesis C-methylase UbiE